MPVPPLKMTGGNLPRPSHPTHPKSCAGARPATPGAGHARHALFTTNQRVPFANRFTTKPNGIAISSVRAPAGPARLENPSSSGYPPGLYGGMCESLDEKEHAWRGRPSSFENCPRRDALDCSDVSVCSRPSHGKSLRPSWLFEINPPKRPTLPPVRGL